MDKKISKMSAMRRLKIGAYGISVTAILIAVIIFVNLFVSSLPVTYTHFAASGMDYYSLSEETKNILNSVETDVTAYLVSDKWEEDQRILELLSRYEAACDKLNVEKVDPENDAEFFEKYMNTGLQENSVIFESEKRTKIVLYTDIYSSDFTDEEVNYYKAMFGYDVPNPVTFEGEMKITSAIDYVSSENLSVVYTLTGHNEMTLDSATIGFIEDHHMIVSELDLAKTEQVPDDCTALIIAVPSVDITESELEIIDSYRSGGGDVLLLTAYGAYSDEQTPNLAALTLKAGMKGDSGLVVESAEGMYFQNPYTLMPEIVAGDAITTLMGETNVDKLIDIAHGIETADGTEIDVKPIVRTSATAVMMDFDEDGSPIERKDEAEENPLMVGAYSETETENGKSTFVWYSSYSLIDSTIESSLKVDGTRRLFIATLDYLTGEREAVSDNGIEMTEAKLEVSKTAGIMWTGVMTVAIPLLILTGGFFVWLRRRYR